MKQFRINIRMLLVKDLSLSVGQSSIVPIRLILSHKENTCHCAQSRVSTFFFSFEYLRSEQHNTHG